MNTVNISLTSGQVKLADNLTRSFDLANRSEFFRILLRIVSRRPELFQAADEIILAPRFQNWQSAFLLGDKIGKNVNLDDTKILQTVKSLRKSRGIKIKSRS